MSKVNSNVTGAFLRGIKGSSGGGAVDAKAVSKAADGLGHKGQRDQKVDSIERGTLKRIGQNLGVDSKVLTAVDAMAGGAKDAKLEVPAAPPKPKQLPEFFDFDSMHEAGSAGVGARAVLFNDKGGNYLRVLEQGDGSFQGAFLKRPEGLPRDAPASAVSQAFDAASPAPIAMTDDVSAYLADKVVAMQLRETASASFDPQNFDQNLKDMVSKTSTASGDATPDWVDFTHFSGSGSSSSHHNGDREQSFGVGDGAAYVRAKKTPEGYSTEIAYLQGENAMFRDDDPSVKYRRISDGEAQHIRDAVDLSNVRGRLWTKFFGGTQLLAQLDGK